MQRQLCEVAVYRYYCRNPQCAQGSFTHLPPGLVPYSRHRTEVHLLAVQMYAFLERHWRKLANSIGSPTIPATNNTVELVIRRFDQHYQSFCGFQSLPDASVYLGVFEKIYRCPFSQDAQPAIRGKCPLQLAGYDVSRLPMMSLCAGLSVIWPMQTAEATDVPNP